MHWPDGVRDTEISELLSPQLLQMPHATREYGMTPTGQSQLPARPAEFSSYDGAAAYLRLVLAGSPIPDWADPISVGGVLLAPCKGPVWVQRTYISQPATGGTDYEKVHHRTQVGHGRHLTIGLWRFTLDKTNMARLLTISSRKVTAAAGVLAALTDERFAVEVLGENVLVVRDGAVAGVVDMTTSVRNYSRAYSMAQVRLVSKAGCHVDSPVERSARWYLKGAQEGPSPEGIVWLCSAIECLVDPMGRQGKKHFNKASLEQAVLAAGDDPTRFEPDLGTVAGLRARVVHYGEEEPLKLREGYYVLEELCRLLIRNRTNESTDWPSRVPSSDTPEDPSITKRYLHGLEWVNTPPESP